MELKGAVVVVTGGGTGMGRAASLLFAQRGAKVIVCGRRPQPLAKTVQLIEQNKTTALAIPTDVKDWVQITKMVDTVLQRYGKVDVLVNNAGIVFTKSVVDTTEKEWDEVLGTNLKGVFLCCKAVLPKMLETNSGVIVNISSTFGQTGSANFGAYCASKFGVIGLTQALAKEVEHKAIKVFAVCPAATHTDLHIKIVGERMAKQSMPPEKVAAKILGLVTGEIPLPTGESLVVDEQPTEFSSYEVEGKWRRVAKWWLRPALPMLRRLKNL